MFLLEFYLWAPWTLKFRTYYARRHFIALRCTRDWNSFRNFSQSEYKIIEHDSCASFLQSDSWFMRENYFELERNRVLCDPLRLSIFLLPYNAYAIQILTAFRRECFTTFAWIYTSIALTTTVPEKCTLIRTENQKKNVLVSGDDRSVTWKYFHRWRLSRVRFFSCFLHRQRRHYQWWWSQDSLR